MVSDQKGNKKVEMETKNILKINNKTRMPPPRNFYK